MKVSRRTYATAAARRPNLGSRPAHTPPLLNLSQEHQANIVPVVGQLIFTCLYTMRTIGGSGSFSNMTPEITSVLCSIGSSFIDPATVHRKIAELHRAAFPNTQGHTPTSNNDQ